MATFLTETASPGLYDLGTGYFTETATPGLYSFTTPLLVEDPDNPGLYFIADIPVQVLTDAQQLTTNRNAYWRIDLLDNTGAPIGTLDGVDGGSLEWSTAQIKGRGTLNVTDTGQGVDWLNVRIKPVYVLNETTEWPRSVFIPTAPIEQWSSMGRSWTVEMLDKSCVLAQDRVDTYYSLAAGTNVLDTVRTLITGAGENAGAITASDETLSTPQAFPAGTAKLTIINKLLDMAGYFALYVDMNGSFRAEPYTRPAQRTLTYEFVDDAQSIYGANFTREVDIYGIPNRVFHKSQGTGDTEALTSTFTNTDPDSPYSYANRGRYIYNTDADTPIDATSQEALDTITQRDLINATSVTATVEIEHAPIEGAQVNNAVRLANIPADIDARHVITKTSLVIEGDGALALAKSTLREVVDL